MNQALAYQALAMLARFFRYGRLSYHGGFVNLRTGRTLDYMEADERFNTASFKDSMEQQWVAVNRSDLIALIDNMQSLSKQWRSSIGKHGELVFYIEVCSNPADLTFRQRVVPPRQLLDGTEHT